MPPRRPAAVLLSVLPLAALLVGCESAANVSRSIRFGERPRWAAGDSWTYRGKGRDGTYTITRTVLREGLFENRDAYEVQVGESRYWYTKQLGYLAEVSDGQVLQRVIPPEDWRWPLRVGKSWSTTVRWVDGAEQDQGDVRTAVWTVEAYEDVKTAAGTFKAFKVTRREIESGASQEFWYSPAVEGWVKRRGTSPAGDYEEELVDYSPR